MTPPVPPPPLPQPVRSFKVRGAYNKMSHLAPEELARGVICSSAGNHAQVGSTGLCLLACTEAGLLRQCDCAAVQPRCFVTLLERRGPNCNSLQPTTLRRPQGVALAARTLGCRAIICMPTNSPEIKINAVKELGGTVELVGESFFEAQIQAKVL